MYTASFTGFLQTILIVLLVYFAFKIFFRWFGPLILKYFMSKLGQRFEQQFKQHSSPFNNSREQEKEGKVSIDKKSANKRKSNKTVGEYIDYEEID